MTDQEIIDDFLKDHPFLKMKEEHKMDLSDEWKEKDLAFLNLALTHSVFEEKYEQAAMYRDLIKQIKEKNKIK